LRLRISYTALKHFLQRIFDTADADPATEIDIDLEQQTIKILPTGEQEHFDINPYKKTCMINGYDDIDFLISILPDIEAFENKRS
jgi:3-isopropylmalate/(R)-2-methylmalate dehydratase small subunit